MPASSQQGYTDMQIMPTMIGVVLLIIVLGMLNSPEIDVAAHKLKFFGFLLLSTGILLFGFSNHMVALNYPESPFNRHTSPLFMNLVCTAAMAYAGYRLVRADYVLVAVLFAVLTLLVLAVSVGCAMYRNKRNQK